MTRRSSALVVALLLILGGAACSSDGDVTAGDGAEATAEQEGAASGGGEGAGDSDATDTTEAGSDTTADEAAASTTSAPPDQGADGEDPVSTGSTEGYASEEICKELQVIDDIDADAETLGEDAEFAAMRSFLVEHVPAAEDALRAAAEISPPELSAHLVVIADAYAALLPGVEAATNEEQLLASYVGFSTPEIETATAAVSEFATDACGFTLS